MPVLSASLLLLAGALAAAGPAAGSHVNLSQDVDAPCEQLDAPADALGLEDPRADRWTFTLTGTTVDGDALSVSPSSTHASPRAFAASAAGPSTYEMELESQRSLFLPNDVFGFLGEEYSTLTGEIATDEGVHDVELLWVGDPANVYSPRAQAGYHMVLEGTITHDDGTEEPIELRLSFPAVTTVCEGSVHVFNWLHLCASVPAVEDPCVPAGYEVTVPLTYYHNGPVPSAGTLDGQATTGVGSGHGVASNTAFAFVPA